MCARIPSKMISNSQWTLNSLVASAFPLCACCSLLDTKYYAYHDKFFGFTPTLLRLWRCKRNCNDIPNNNNNININDTCVGSMIIKKNLIFWMNIWITIVMIFFWFVFMLRYAVCCMSSIYFFFFWTMTINEWKSNITMIIQSLLLFFYYHYYYDYPRVTDSNGKISIEKIYSQISIKISASQTLCSACHTIPEWLPIVIIIIIIIAVIELIQ